MWQAQPQGQLRPLFPPVSPTLRRSPTPDPTGPRLMEEPPRQRATSFGETTPRAAARPLPSDASLNAPAPSVRSMFGGSSHSGASASGRGIGVGHKDNSLAVRGATSQPASGRTSPALSIQTRPTRLGSTPGPGRPIRTGSTGSTQASSPLKSTDNYSLRTVAPGLESGPEGRSTDDAWQAVCLRVLPLL